MTAGDRGLIGVVVGWLGLAIVGRSPFDGLAVGAVWVRVLGLAGLLLGATLLSGIGQWIVLVPVALILFEVKIRMEEHLMVATFPEEYPRYRRQVPQLIPGLYALRQRHSASSHR